MQRQFKAYLVGPGVITAKELVLKQTSICWKVAEEKLQYLRNTNLPASQNPNQQALNIFVRTTPSLEAILADQNGVGNLQLEITINDEFSYSKQLPYTKALIKNAIEEHIYWLILTHIKGENKDATII